MLDVQYAFDVEDDDELMMQKCVAGEALTMVCQYAFDVEDDEYDLM